MQLMAIGDAIVNLDRVTVIDVDRDSRTGVISLKVHGDSKDPVITFNGVGQDVINSLFNLIPQPLRFRPAREEI
jgi:hypothetical protein